MFHRKVTDDHNQMLMHKFEEKEIKEAVFSMRPDKSPGSDGMKLMLLSGILGYSWCSGNRSMP